MLRLTQLQAAARLFVVYDKFTSQHTRHYCEAKRRLLCHYKPVSCLNQMYLPVSALLPWVGGGRAPDMHWMLGWESLHVQRESNADPPVGYSVCQLSCSALISVSVYKAVPHLRKHILTSISWMVIINQSSGLALSPCPINYIVFLWPGR